MEPDTSKDESINDRKSVLTTVTPFSKYLAMILFVALPFIGGWVGYMYAPLKVVEKEKVELITSSQNENKLPPIADIQKMFLEGKPEYYEIKPLYTTKENDVQYFQLLNGTSACCSVYKYLAEKNSFHLTGIGINVMIGEKESPLGRYVVKVPWEKTLEVYDLETQSVEKSMTVSEEETLVSETCGYAGYSYDLEWLNESTLQYGVYKTLDVETSCPKMELIEHRIIKME